MRYADKCPGCGHAEHFGKCFHISARLEPCLCKTRAKSLASRTMEAINREAFEKRTGKAATW